MAADWALRLKEEAQQLNARLVKLSEFIESDEFDTLAEYNQKLLLRQCRAMGDYADVLTTRLVHAKDDGQFFTAPPSSSEGSSAATG
jgi:hypothetical protein